MLPDGAEVLYHCLCVPARIEDPTADYQHCGPKYRVPDQTAIGGDPGKFKRRKALILRIRGQHSNKVKRDTQIAADQWIFLCGSTAVPEERKPPVRWKETVKPEQGYRT